MTGIELIVSLAIIIATFIFTFKLLNRWCWIQNAPEEKDFLPLNQKEKTLILRQRELNKIK
tara:strand:- start:404 stop:586 length:183 start_codon:yes stop_codon:yes gene_type:complete